MKLVVALGDEEPSAAGAPSTRERRRSYVARAAAAIAPLRRAGHDVVVTHGNGPHIGMFALQAASTPDRPFPLDALDGEHEGMIVHQIEQALLSELPASEPVATLLTQVRVDRDDPAFLHPTQPIGAYYSESEARVLAAERGWRIARDGRRWRRVVPSPKPLAILEARAIEILLERGVTVICAGGGLPVIRREDGSLIGVEGVVDKDLASALLAKQLGAHWLVMLSEVDALYRDQGAAARRRVASASPGELGALRSPNDTVARIMAAARDFVAETGGRAGIGRLDDVARIISGEVGTTVAAPRS